MRRVRRTYYSSEGEAGRLAESMDDLFSLIVSCICWHDCCDAKEYADSKILEEYGQRQRNINLEDMDMDSWRRVADALGIPTDEPLAPVLERFRKATQRQPLYQCMFHEDDGSLTESYGLMLSLIHIYRDAMIGVILLRNGNIHTAAFVPPGVLHQLLNLAAQIARDRDAFFDHGSILLFFVTTAGRSGYISYSVLCP